MGFLLLISNMAYDKLPSDYDAIVLGTGMTECIIAAALARNGLQVLHLDRNDYYSADWATFHFEALQKWIARKQGQVEDKLTAPDCDLNSLLEEEENLLPLELASSSISNVTDHVYIRENAPPEEGGGDGKRENSEVVKETTCVEHERNLPDVVPGQFDGPEEEDSETAATSSGKVEKETDALENTAPVEEGLFQLKVEEKQKTEEAEEKTWTLEDLKKQWRKFNLDLTPRVLYGRGSMVELLISSDIAKYCEFKTVTRVLTYLNNKLEQVPCSRSDVFSSKQVSMIEKRMLMKLLTFCMDFDSHPQEYAAFEDKTFAEFLSSRKLTPNVQHYVLRAIAMATDKTSTLEGLKSTQKFLKSLGRYGNTAFLWPLYGCGELPQCFCRMCAVFGGIYCLRRTAVSMITDKERKCKGVIDTEGQRLNSKWLIMEASFASQKLLPENTMKRFTSRAIFITNRSIMPADTEHITLLSLPPGPGQKVPTTVFELAPMSMACPKGLYVVQVMAEGVTSAEADIKPVVDLLFQSVNEEERLDEDGRPVVLWDVYFDQLDVASDDLSSQAPDNVFIVPGPDNNLDFESSIKEARRIFDLVCPGDEFLPKAPNPEDIIWGDEGQEGQGGGFDGGDMQDAECDKEPQEEGGKAEQKEQVVPSTEQVVPSEEQVVPSTEKVAPTEEQSAPTEEQVVPTKEQVVPPEEQVVPSEPECEPSRELTKPSTEPGDIQGAPPCTAETAGSTPSVES